MKLKSQRFVHDVLSRNPRMLHLLDWRRCLIRVENAAGDVPGRWRVSGELHKTCHGNRFDQGQTEGGTYLQSPRKT